MKKRLTARPPFAFCIFALLALALGASTSMFCQAAAATITHQSVEGSGEEMILISGEINLTDSVTFKNLAVRYENAVVVLSSPGGLLRPALEIGRLIRLRGYSTFVADDSVCASSCALIWLAGSPRYLSEGGRVGFHASYRSENGALVERGVGNALIGHYLSSLSLSEKAVVFATLAPPDEILWLTDDVRSASGIQYELLKLSTPSQTAQTSSQMSIAAVDIGEQSYLRAYDLWSARRYGDAGYELQRFLHNYPQHARATYARELLGRVYLDQGNALEAAKWFVQNYQSDRHGYRAPDSLLHLVESMRQLNDVKRACVALAEFRSAYPAEASGRLSGEYQMIRRRVNCG